jgi:hypothetical protein
MKRKRDARDGMYNEGGRKRTSPPPPPSSMRRMSLPRKAKTSRTSYLVGLYGDGSDLCATATVHPQPPILSILSAEHSLHDLVRAACMLAKLKTNAPDDFERLKPIPPTLPILPETLEDGWRSTSYVPVALEPPPHLLE